MVFLSRSTPASRFASWISTTSGDPLGLVLLGFFYFKLFMTFSPFSRGNSVGEAGCAACGSGSIENQIQWLLLFAFACFIIWRNWASSISLLLRSWYILVPLLWILLTILWSADSSITLRRAGLLAVMAGISFAISAARPSPADFLKLSAVILGLFLSVSVAGVFLVPHLAKTGSNFVGIYSHKNGAGYVASVVVVFWVFFITWVRQFEIRILAVFAAAVWLFFLVGTASKTAIGLGLLAPVIGIAVYYVLALPLAGRFISYVGGVILSAVLVFLVLFMNLTIEDIGVLIFDDLTFTGRTYVWEFLLRSIEQRPLLGYGYGAFWKTGTENLLMDTEGKGWVETVGSAHNGYLSIWVETGIIGLLAAMGALFAAIRRSLLLLKNSDPWSVDRWIYAMLVAHLLMLMLRHMMESGFFGSGSSSTALFFMIYFLTVAWQQREEEILQE